jgi:hypothetical protein
MKNCEDCGAEVPITRGRQPRVSRGLPVWCSQRCRARWRWRTGDDGIRRGAVVSAAKRAARPVTPIAALMRQALDREEELLLRAEERQIVLRVLHKAGLACYRRGYVAGHRRRAQS